MISYSMNYDYIAGFIDGEGCIGVYKNRYHIIFQIQISNTNRLVLEEIDKFLILQGINGKVGLLHHKTDKWKEAYSYTISNRKDILWLLLNISNRLVVKKSQAEYVLSNCSLSFGGNKNFNVDEFKSLRN